MDSFVLIARLPIFGYPGLVLLRLLLTTRSIGATRPQSKSPVQPGGASKVSYFTVWVMATSESGTDRHRSGIGHSIAVPAIPGFDAHAPVAEEGVPDAGPRCADDRLLVNTKTPRRDAG